MTTLECENALVSLETNAPMGSTSKNASTVVVIKNSGGDIIFTMIVPSNGATTINVNVDGWDRRRD